jgi:hypothetical protein
MLNITSLMATKRSLPERSLPVYSGKLPKCPWGSIASRIASCHGLD